MNKWSCSLTGEAKRDNDWTLMLLSQWMFQLGKVNFFATFTP